MDFKTLNKIVKFDTAIEDVYDHLYGILYYLLPVIEVDLQNAGYDNKAIQKNLEELVDKVGKFNKEIETMVSDISDKYYSEQYGR